MDIDDVIISGGESGVNKFGIKSKAAIVTHTPSGLRAASTTESTFEANRKIAVKRLRVKWLAANSEESYYCKSCGGKVGQSNIIWQLSSDDKHKRICGIHNEPLYTQLELINSFSDELELTRTEISRIEKHIHGLNARLTRLRHKEHKLNERNQLIKG